MNGEKMKSLSHCVFQVLTGNLLGVCAAGIKALVG